MNKEIAIIQRELKIPMDNVIFNEIHPYVEILSANMYRTPFLGPKQQQVKSN